MKKWIIRKPEMYRAMREATFSPGIAATIIIAFFMLVVNYIIREIPASIIDYSYYVSHPASNSHDAIQVVINYATAPSTLLWVLSLTVILIAIVILYVKRIEKRPLSTIGISKQRPLPHFALGYLLGALQLALSAVWLTVQDAPAYTGFQPVALLFIPAFIVQASSEEILYRGYMLSSFTAKTGIIRAVLLTSVLFSLMHSDSYGFNLLFLVELFFSGILFAFLTVRTNSIWAACGAHAAWNFMAGLASPFVHGHIVTNYSMLTLNTDALTDWGTVGSPYMLPVISLDIILIALVLFAGKNRLVTRPTEGEQMYFRALGIAKTALKHCKDDFGKPYIHHPLGIAQMLDGDTARITVLLAAACNIGGFTVDSLTGYCKDVVLAVTALIRRDDTDQEYGMRVRANPTALEVWKAQTAFEEKLLIEKTQWNKRRSKAISQSCDIHPCPMLRRDIQDAECLDISRMVDDYADDDAHAALRYLDRSQCERCAKHRQKSAELGSLSAQQSTPD